jgi:osmotically-inducible protein OsmY
MALLENMTLTAKVKTALMTDEHLAEAHIDVDVEGDVVTLRGTVPYEGQRDLAEQIARHAGARHVENRLAVEHPGEGPASAIIPPWFPPVSTPPGAPPVEHPAGEQGVREALAADPRVNERLVVVQVADGIAYLTGRQDTVDARDAATETAAHVPGITGVVNEIEVMPSV